MPNKVSKTLIKADKACDYAPGPSTATNKVDLTIKACATAVIPSARPVQAMSTCIQSGPLRPDIIIRRATEV